MKIKIIWFIVCLFFSLLFTGCGSPVYESVKTDQESGTESSEDAGEMLPESGSSKEAQQIVPTRICIYIVGAVCSPGVYELAENSRVCDAVAAAGGLTEEAELSHINQAKLLSDGEQITVLTKEEALTAGAMPGVQISEEKSGLININTADAAALKSLSGIGEAKAAAIVEYRTSCGGFRTIEEITKVNGIGQALYSRIKDNITVG